MYLLLTVAVGFWASRKVKGSGDFLLAGRSLPMVLSSSALFATWFGSETVFGASSRFLEGGLFAVIEDPFGAALCLLLFGMFFARKLYNMNLLTLGDFFKVRFGRRTEIVSECVYGACLFWVHRRAVSSAWPYLAHSHRYSGVGRCSYQCDGGNTLHLCGRHVGHFYYRFIQSIIIVIGLFIVAFVLVEKAGGFANVMHNVPTDTFRFLPAPTFYSVITWFAAWSILGLGSLPSQDVFQRTMSSGSANVAVKSCFYAAALYLSVAMLPLFISLCIRHLYPGEIAGDTQVTLLNMVTTHTALPVQIVFFGSLLSAIMSTASSSMLAPAALFSENIIKPLSNGKLSDKQLLYTTRLSLLFFSAISTIMACLNSDIYELVGGSSILSLVSLFIPLTFGLYWKRANSTGALLSMTVGMALWGFFELYPMEIPSLMPATLGSLVAMVGGSLFIKD